MFSGVFDVPCDCYGKTNSLSLSFLQLIDLEVCFHQTVIEN